MASTTTEAAAAAPSTATASVSTILVIGATGNIGKATVTSLAAKYGATVAIKAGVRNVESDKAKELAKLPGVSLVKADMSADDSVTAAAKGADVVFLVTPGAENRADLVVAAAKAVAASDAKALVAVSVPHGDKEDILFARQFKAAEAGITAAGLPTTFLRLPFFIDNQYGNIGSIKGQSAFYSPINPDSKYGAIAVQDAGDAAAAVLANPAPHAGKAYTLISDMLTETAVAAAFTAALGREIKHVQVPPAAAKEAMIGAGWPKWQVEGILELHAAINAGDARQTTPSSDVETLTGRKPTSIAAWAKAAAPAFK